MHQQILMYILCHKMNIIVLENVLKKKMSAKNYYVINVEEQKHYMLVHK
jgi:hypothetical protein